MFYTTVKFIAGIFVKIAFKIEVEGLENIPKDGNIIFSANHTSNWDPIVFSIISPRKIRWMGKQELFDHRLLGSFLGKLGVFPVKRGETDVVAIKTAFRVLKDNEALGLFPEGTRIDGFNIENANPGVSMISVRSKTPIIPIYIDSDYRLFSRIKINIGQAIDYSKSIEGKPTQEEYKKISQDLLYEIYSLKDKDEEV